MYILGYIYYLRETLAGGLPAQPVATGPGLLHGLGRLLRALRAAFGHWRTQVRIERDLAKLPDWALRDIGLERGEISGLAETLAQSAHEGARPAPRTRVHPSAHPTVHPSGHSSGARLSVVGCG